MRSWRAKMLVLIGVLSIVAAACGDDDGGETGGAGGTATGGTAGAECNADIQVGVALDVGGLGDNGFNDLAKAGLDQAIADGVVCQENTKFLRVQLDGNEPRREHPVAGRRGLRRDHRDRVRVHGGSTRSPPTIPTRPSASSMAMPRAGPDARSRTTRAIPNVADLTFTEEQGSFLVGAPRRPRRRAGCDTIGFLGGQTGPLIGKFEAGYRAGVAEIDPNMTVLVEYLGDTRRRSTTLTGGEATSKMYDDGACIIYHAAGDSGNGLFAAAAQQQKLAIGVDSDQYHAATAEQQPLIMTSMMKRVDTATYDFITSVGDGTFEAGAPRLRSRR